MHFDIEEVVRQKQYVHEESIRIDSGDDVDISICDDGTVVVRPEAKP